MGSARAVGLGSEVRAAGHRGADADSPLGASLAWCASVCNAERTVPSYASGRPGNPAIAMRAVGLAGVLAEVETSTA